MHPCHVFLCHVWVLSHVHLVAFSWLLAVNRRSVQYLNRLPFPNRNSDSGVLFIVFKRFHLIFPVAHLDFQVKARFIHSFANHAYASHTASRISYHVHVLVVYYVVCFFSGVCFFGLVPITSRCEDPFVYVAFVFFMDSFFFLAGFQAR